jgi:uncharacterized protein (TIGR02444 family)
MTNGPAKFWRYSLALYERAGEACLHLQDHHRLDVNMLLICCWTGSRGRALADAEIIAAQTAAAPWRDNVIEPLRRARRFLKAQTVPVGAVDLRRRILALELEAERAEQALLLDAVEGLDAPPADLAPGEASGQPALVVANLHSYLRLTKAELLDDGAKALITLVSSAFPEMGEAAIVDLMGRSVTTG